MTTMNGREGGYRNNIDFHLFAPYLFAFVAHYIALSLHKCHLSQQLNQNCNHPKVPKQSIPCADHLLEVSLKPKR